MFMLECVYLYINIYRYMFWGGVRLVRQYKSGSSPGGLSFVFGIVTRSRRSESNNLFLAPWPLPPCDVCERESITFLGRNLVGASS